MGREAGGSLAFSTAWIGLDSDFDVRLTTSRLAFRLERRREEDSYDTVGSGEGDGGGRGDRVATGDRRGEVCGAGIGKDQRIAY